MNRTAFAYKTGTRIACFCQKSALMLPAVLCLFLVLFFPATKSPAQTVSLGCPTTQSHNCICDPESCDRFDTVDRPVNTTEPIPPRGQCEGGTNPGSFDSEAHFQQLVDYMHTNWIPALVYMTEQFTMVMMHQMLAIGTFFDAKHQMESQRIFSDLQARAHNQYHSNVQMCRFGTNVRSLLSSEMRARQNMFVLNKAMADREALNLMTAGAEGDFADHEHRMQQFGRLYCSLSEANARIGPLCYMTSGLAENIGRDIDYARIFEDRYTLNIDFTTNDPSSVAYAMDEQDILALSSNIFASDLYPVLPAHIIRQPAGQEAYMHKRSLMAIRSMARYSFSSLVAMRSSGTPGSAPYLKTIIEELGVPEDEINDFLGENPSYFAQMEVLTKKMYQNPVFFTNLYDTPENVTRAGVAMQAIKLMNDRDRFESAQRRELLISLILELQLRRHQDEMNRRLYATSRDIPDLD